MSKKHYPNYEQDKNNAKDVDLIDFLETRYPGEIIRKNSEYVRADDHAVKILTYRQKMTIGKYGATYCNWNKQNENLGDNINYLMEFHNMSYYQAVKELLDFGKFDCRDFNEGIKKYHKDKKKYDNTPKPKPPINSSFLEDIKRYLMEERCISEDIINDCIQKGILYATEYRRMCFYNPDDQSYSIRDLKHTDPFMQSVSGVNYWVYKTSDNIKKIYICESCIDCLSLCEILRRPKDTAFIAMYGIKYHNARKAIEDFPNATAKIAVDWDEHGIKFYRDNFSGEYDFLHGNEFFRKHTKDWNEVLQMIKKKR